MREERLFIAIGGADPALLERSGRGSGRSRALWRGGLAAAACLAVLCALAFSTRRPAVPVQPDGPQTPDVAPAAPEVLALTGGDVGRLHLVQLRYGAEERDSAADDFILYVNEETYSGTWEEGNYVVRPLLPGPEGAPECSLTVAHREDTALEAAAEAVREALAEEYDVVQEQPGAEGRASLAAWDGTEWGAEWDAANAGVTLVDDRQGGVFVLTARYFTEAAEGHGARFADMMEAFQPLPDSVAVPQWMTALRETVDALLPAVFSDRWTPEAKELLAEDAQMCGYEEDVSGWVSISAVDIAVDGGLDPASAVVSVRHRLGGEEPAGCLIMELSRQDGRWLARSVRLE